MSNEQLDKILEGCRHNERISQKDLYRNYYSYIMSIALRYSSDNSNAVEMTNDTFLKIFKDVNRFVPRYGNTLASFTAWIKKVAIYTCIDYIRKYNKSTITTSIDVEQSIPADPGENAEDMLQHKEVIKCIQQLSRAYRAVFNLYVIEGFSHAEIAQKLNISEGASKSNLHKAKQNLQQFLKKRHIVNYEPNLC
jgi:RNA polymerase sigma-70 factor, ECF subfamily